MYGYIKGKITYVTSNYIIIDNILSNFKKKIKNR